MESGGGDAGIHRGLESLSMPDKMDWGWIMDQHVDLFMATWASEGTEHGRPSNQPADEDIPMAIMEFGNENDWSSVYEKILEEFPSDGECMLAIFKGPSELAPQTLPWEPGFRPLAFGRAAPVLSIKAQFEHPQPTSIP